MKGLLLKDIYNLRKVGKQYILILAFFTVYCFFLKNPSFFPMMTVMSFSMLILTSMGYDEAAGFDKYALTLPVNREDLVRTKYLLLLLLLAAGFVVGMTGNVLIKRILFPLRRLRLSFFWSIRPCFLWYLKWGWRRRGCRC